MAGGERPEPWTTEDRRRMNAVQQAFLHSPGEVGWLAGVEV